MEKNLDANKIDWEKTEIFFNISSFDLKIAISGVYPRTGAQK